VDHESRHAVARGRRHGAAEPARLERRRRVDRFILHPQAPNADFCGKLGQLDERREAFTQRDRRPFRNGKASE
jgi:hypothetical protein